MQMYAGPIAGIYTRVLLLPIIKSSLGTTSRLFKLQALHTIAGDLITTFFCHIPTTSYFTARVV